MISKLVKKSRFLFIPSMFVRDFWALRNVTKKLPDEWSLPLKELRNNGVCVAPITFDDNFLLLSIDEIDKTINSADISGSDYRTFGAEKKSPTIKHLFSDHKLLLDAACKYLYSDTILQTTLAAKLTFQPDNLGSGQGWHRDSYSKQFKAMVYLSDVGEDSGPFEYLLGSHRYGKIIHEIMIKKKDGRLLSHSRFTDDEIHDLKQKLSLKSVKYVAKKGTVILFDSRGLHRGSPIKSGYRYALTNYYVKKSHVS